MARHGGEPFKSLNEGRGRPQSPLTRGSASATVAVRRDEITEPAFQACIHGTQLAQQAGIQLLTDARPERTAGAIFGLVLQNAAGSPTDTWTLGTFRIP